ncbi:Major Facilitator Superfamily protein [Amycolatopsis marina]|uniref:Major Facilitator Superfamily protein n=1 Tax=Amycolatopsis marina TaxID=490629 RepID=A0A1I1BDA7_9PSEU|nr:MFS transporter [Amycolatopsis marina]SFB48365.1 Major Facilitator Superfamily protein [Amycolatopsis marina]
MVVAYGLVTGGFLLVGGRMTDLLGRRRVFLAGLSLFTPAPLVAGLAQHGGVLITARGLQGLDGARIAPAALSLVAATFREGRERNRAFGIFACGRSRRLDVAEASAVTGALLTSVYALHHAATHGWASVSTLAWFVAAGVLMTAFVSIERRSPAPLVPGKMLRNRTLVAVNLTALLAFGVFFSLIFLGALLMQQELGYSPRQTGLAWLATTLTEFVSASAAGRPTAVMSVRGMLATGLTLLATAMVWLTQVSADGNYLIGLLPAFLLAGIGFGLCVPALQIGALFGVTVVATVLVAGTGLDGFHTAFAAVGVLAGLGTITTMVGFRKK